MQKIEVGQLWADLDMRNAVEHEGGQIEPRTVEIVETPTGSKQGVFRVVAAPRNKRSEGQTRGFTEAKLRAHYALVRRPGDGLGDGVAEGRAQGVMI